eukprot:scaffold7242_cov130-Isochrysis_galbana.AAC.2
MSTPMSLPTFVKPRRVTVKSLFANNAIASSGSIKYPRPRTHPQSCITFLSQVHFSTGLTECQKGFAPAADYQARAILHGHARLVHKDFAAVHNLLNKPKEAGLEITEANLQHRQAQMHLWATCQPGIVTPEVQQGGFHLFEYVSVSE